MRLPCWRQSSYDAWDTTTGVIDGAFSFLVLVPFFLIVVPLATFVAELPVAFVRGLLSPDGWIEATTWYPSRVTIVWRVSDRRTLPEFLATITDRLARGYDELEFEGVELVEMTEPLGFRDIVA